ncbi:MAG: MBL fold metallo-hydrolase [Bacteroidales bacterium]|nr:MBL fold metallo-hydrolase [Candidatus Cacconaster merdequi]
MNRITFWGTGTSQGMPMIGCRCPVCTSTDTRDKRLRSSALVDYCGKSFLIDAGPDFRQQMLRSGRTHIDAILLTHHHVDHTGGLDDVRALNYLENRSFPVFCEKHVEQSLEKQFYYAFSEYKYPGAPEYDVRLITSLPFDVDGVEVVPIRAMHYKLPILGFRFGGCAYLTDANFIPESEFEKLKGLDIFVLNTVKRGKHISHFSLSEAIDVAKRVGAKRTFLTHLSHLLPKYSDFVAELPEGIEPAYDGLEVEF